MSDTAFSFSDLQKVAKEAGFSLVPDGEYDAVIDKGAKTKKSGNGKDMIVVKWKIAAGPVKGSVFQNFVISPESPGALAYFFGDMKKLGLDDDFFAALPAGEAGLKRVAEALEGRAAKITVGHREWNGSDRNEITAIKKSAGTNGVSVPVVKQSGVPSVGTPAAAPTPQITPQNTDAAPAPVPTPSESTSEAASQAAPPDDPFAV